MKGFLVMKSCNVILDLTEDCMLRCSYCYINGGESHLNMSTKTAINTITKFSRSYADGKIHLLFHGGEPLLMFDRIQEIINFIENNDIRNIELYIQTNGIEVDQYVSKYLKNKNVRTCISIDGFTPEANVTRKSESENSTVTTRRILKGMDHLLEEGHEISTICVLNKMNLGFIDQYFDECVARGIGLISMNPIINLGRSTLHEELLLSNQEISQAYISAIQKIESLLGNGFNIIERNCFYYFRRYITEKPEYMCMNTPCGAGNCVFVIKCNGDIFPCSDFSFIPDLRLGNVNEETLFSIKKDQSKELLYQLYNDSLNKNSKCIQCHWNKKCFSGCVARKYLATQQIGGVLDPLCSMYQELNSFFDEKSERLTYFSKRVNPGLHDQEVMV